MKSEHPVMEMADALEVSARGYAEHLKKDERPRRREDEELGEKLTAIFKANRKTYGTPRLQIALGQQGIRCGKQRIARLQRRFGLHPVQKRRFVRKPRKAIRACPWRRTSWPSAHARSTQSNLGQLPANFAQALSGADCVRLATLAFTPSAPERALRS